MMANTVTRMVIVYAVQVALMVGALVFGQYSANFFCGALWVTLFVLKIGTWWSWCYPLWLVALCYITLQDPFSGYPWVIIPVTLGIFLVYGGWYVFSRTFRQALDQGLSLGDLTLYLGHRVIGAYSFSKIIDESSEALVATHNPLEVMNTHWVYSAGIIDFIVAFAAPLTAYWLYNSTRQTDASSQPAARPPTWLLLLVALVNIIGFADFCVVGVGYSLLLLPGPLQMAGVKVSVIPMTHFPLAVLVIGLAPVSMLFHIVSLHRIVMLLRLPSPAKP